MKQFYINRIFQLVIGFFPLLLTAQKTGSAPLRMVRIYEDNDFINIRGKGTDEAYTNGTRLDFFYTKPVRPGFFADRLLPSAGDSSVNVSGWSITQLMVTPRDISIAAYQPMDYPYSGALFLTHGNYSYNHVKKYSLQTEMMVGVRGSASFAAETQTFIHRLIHYQKPMGWNNQLKNKPILNIRISAEKQIYSFRNILEVIGGSEIFAGTFLNSAVIYPTIRIGKMTPYFRGLISQYTALPVSSGKKKKNIQAYFVIKPGIMLTASNSLLQSGSQKFPVADKNTSAPDIREAVYTFSGSAVLVINRFGISFTQNITGATIHSLYEHQVGNISLFFSW